MTRNVNTVEKKLQKSVIVLIICTKIEFIRTGGGIRMPGYIKAWFMINKTEKGQDLAEYALLIGLIALLVLISVTFLGTQIDSIFSAIGNGISTWDVP